MHYCMIRNCSRLKVGTCIIDLEKASATDTKSETSVRPPAPWLTPCTIFGRASCVPLIFSSIHWSISNDSRCRELLNAYDHGRVGLTSNTE